MDQQNQNKRTYNGSAFWNNPQPVSPPSSQSPEVNQPTQTYATELQKTVDPPPSAPVTEFHPVITSDKAGNAPSKKTGIIIGVISAAVVIVTGIVVTILLASGSPKKDPGQVVAATQAFLSQEEKSNDAGSVTDNTIAVQPTINETAAPTNAPEAIGAQVEYETRKLEVQNATYFKSASASSVLPDQAGHNYKASNVLKDDGTCWCEDASDYGEDEWIKLELPALQKVSGLRIINGYAGTEKQYEYNSKISKMTIEFSDGRSTQVNLNVFDTADRKTVQTIRFNAPIETEYVKLTIDSVTKGDCKDTCLTFVEPF